MLALIVHVLYYALSPDLHGNSLLLSLKSDQSLLQRLQDILQDAHIHSHMSPLVSTVFTSITKQLNVDVIQLSVFH